MRPDGTVLLRSANGYDPETQYYCAFGEGLSQLDVPLFPTKDDVAKAVALVCEMLRDFCFASPRAVNIANFIAALITFLLHLVIHDFTPILMIDATIGGSGKGLLVHLLSLIILGHTARNSVAPLNREREEWRKKIDSIMLAGESLAIFDNVVGELDVPELCALVTTYEYSGRVLGSNTWFTADATYCKWIFAGNALAPVIDLVRRSYWVRLNPERHDPQNRTDLSRTYDQLIEWTKQNRPRLVRALLIICRSWFAAGCPEGTNLRPFANFQRWATIVGSILQHAGVTGFLGETHDSYTDPRAEEWLTFLLAIGEVTRWDKFPVSELSRIADESTWDSGKSRLEPTAKAAKLRNAMPSELAKKLFDSKGRVLGSFSQVLGAAFREQRNHYYGEEGLHISVVDKDQTTKVNLWQVQRGAAKAQDPPSGGPAVGDVKHYQGKTFVFDGKDYVEQV